MLYVTNVMAVSLDGKIASKPLESDSERRALGFSSTEDHKQLLKCIENSDAIILGAHSVRVSGGIIDQSKKNGDYPLWLIYTHQGIPPNHPFWDLKHIPKILIFSQKNDAFFQTPEENRLFVPNDLAKNTLRYLENRGLKKILLFGGGQINKIFYESELVDELYITICPIIVGNYDAPALIGGGVIKPTSLLLTSSMPSSNHVFLKYKVIKK